MSIFRKVLLLGLLFSPGLFCYADIDWGDTEVDLIPNHEYTRRIYKLIRGANSKIRLCLEVCEFPEDPDHILYRLLREVVNQASRGTDVEIILDQGDANKRAREFLYR